MSETIQQSFCWKSSFFVWVLYRIFWSNSLFNNSKNFSNKKFLIFYLSNDFKSLQYIIKIFHLIIAWTNSESFWNFLLTLRSLGYMSTTLMVCVLFMCVRVRVFDFMKGLTQLKSDGSTSELPLWQSLVNTHNDSYAFVLFQPITLHFKITFSFEICSCFFSSKGANNSLPSTSSVRHFYCWTSLSLTVLVSLINWWNWGMCYYNRMFASGGMDGRVNFYWPRCWLLLWKKVM